MKELCFIKLLNFSLLANRVIQIYKKYKGKKIPLHIIINHRRLTFVLLQYAMTKLVNSCYFTLDLPLAEKNKEYDNCCFAKRVIRFIGIFV